MKGKAVMTNPAPMTESNWREITALLPTLSDLTTAAPAPRSSFWTEAEEATALRASAGRFIKAGFAWNGTHFVKGQGRSKIEARPTRLMPSKSGQPDFNPRTDAFAVRMGAEFVSDNRYRLEGVGVMDRNGMFVAPDECPECGDMVLYVKSRKGVKPDAPVYKYNLTYCRRCITQAEVDDMRREQDAARAKQNAKARR